MSEVTIDQIWEYEETGLIRVPKRLIAIYANGVPVYVGDELIIERTPMTKEEANHRLPELLNKE